MDPAFTMRQVIAPYWVRIRAGFTELQNCRGVAAAPDGDINLGANPGNSNTSFCRPHSNLVLVTPNYSAQERQAGTPLTWRVEFSTEAGFPPPDPGQQVWIEFTLVPGP
jgi:hypothetical protein